jgi:hypothetical protein
MTNVLRVKNRCRGAKSVRGYLAAVGPVNLDETYKRCLRGRSSALSVANGAMVMALALASMTSSKRQTEQR